MRRTGKIALQLAKFDDRLVIMCSVLNVLTTANLIYTISLKVCTSVCPNKGSRTKRSNDMKILQNVPLQICKSTILFSTHN